jgi:hypothetical protein
MRITPTKRVSTIVLFIALLGATAVAQEQTVARNSERATALQSAASVLSALPDADTLIYINPQRIFSEAAPKVIAEGDLAMLRDQFTQVKNGFGVDPAKLDLLIIAVRFRKPTGELNFQSPEVLAVMSGDFSADSLLTNARMLVDDKVVDEKYGSRTLALIRIDDIAEQAEKNPLLKPFAQIGAVSLNSNTIATGTVAYLKAAVDAADGRDRISPATLNSLVRDPNALISFAGSPWSSFAKSFGLAGTETTPRTNNCDTKLGNFYAAVTLEGSSFRVRGSMNADNPDTAKLITGILSGVMKSFGSEDADVKSFPSMLRMMTLTASDAEIVLQADFPQQVVADFLKEQMKPKVVPTPNVTSPKAPVRKRRTARKRTQ